MADVMQERLAMMRTSSRQMAVVLSARWSKAFLALLCYAQALGEMFLISASQSAAMVCGSSGRSVTMATK
jgi:hypothetical protein